MRGTATPAAPAALRAGVLQWYRRRRRALPWRGTGDPYAVLVSEIMLQQTQVNRVAPAFDSFMRRFPDVRTLATAPRADVVTAWAGLGYNRRAVALHLAARTILERHGGAVPSTLEELLALPGVGPYTARAVLAFAHGHDAAPVDTNVSRVLTRAVAGAPLGGAALQRLADASVPPGRGRDWSAALMDLASAHCRARSPVCEGCPIAAQCAWRRAGGDDPARRAATPAAPFAGSDRALRGRLVDLLRDDAVARSQLADVLGTDTARATGIADALVADGLAQWDRSRLRLAT